MYTLSEDVPYDVMYRNMYTLSEDVHMCTHCQRTYICVHTVRGRTYVYTLSEDVHMCTHCQRMYICVHTVRGCTLT